MKYISYPFVISKNESKLQEGFLNLMKQIYPEPDALQYILLTIVKALCGDLNEHFTYFYGSGSNGKSTTFSIIESVFEDKVYSRRLDGSAFKDDHESRMIFLEQIQILDSLS